MNNAIIAVKNSPLELSSHNDFLEMLFNYGIIGFVPYLVLHFQLIKQIFTGIKMHNKNAIIIPITCASVSFNIINPQKNFSTKLFYKLKFLYKSKIILFAIK